RYHNVMTVHGKDQMEPASRFLWAPWARGNWHPRRSFEEDIEVIEGEHDGYMRLDGSARYRRAHVRVGQEHWLIVDRLTSDEPHEVCLHWLLEDTNASAKIRQPGADDSGRIDITLDTSAGQYDVVIGSTADGV